MSNLTSCANHCTTDSSNTLIGSKNDSGNLKGNLSTTRTEAKLSYISCICCVSVLNRDMFSSSSYCTVAKSNLSHVDTSRKCSRISNHCSCAWGCYLPKSNCRSYKRSPCGRDWSIVISTRRRIGSNLSNASSNLYHGDKSKPTHLREWSGQTHRS
jgi:hypothetical protein